MSEHVHVRDGVDPIAAGAPAAPEDQAVEVEEAGVEEEVEAGDRPPLEDDPFREVSEEAPQSPSALQDSAIAPQDQDEAVEP